MSAFIPALLAVLLAEIGGRSAAFARLPRTMLAAGALIMSTTAGAVAGLVIAPTMNARARALLLGLALLVAAAGFFERRVRDLPVTALQTLLFVTRTNVAFLAFALATWRGDASGAALGALAGFAGAIMLGPMIEGSLLPRVRAFSLTVIAFFGAYAALWALRLIG